MPFYYSFDSYYLILVVPAILFSLYAQFSIKRSYRKYSGLYARRGMTGAQVSEMILQQNGIYDVSVQRVSGNLTDHYNPKSKVIALSEGVYNSTSVAAIGVAAHETGHAIQHEKRYLPGIIRSAIVPVTNIGSQLSIPIILLGAFLSQPTLINIGLALFSLMVVFQLVTLPVEFDASSRALRIIRQQGILEGEELTGARKVLTAAALTYIAAFLVTAANLLRMVLLFGNRRRD